MAGGMTVLMLRSLSVCIWLKLVLAYQMCEKKDECSCLTDEGGISLWGLAESGDRPRFADIPSNDRSYRSFSWNPCYPYTVSKSHNKCRDVAACAQTRIYYYYAIAEQDTATCVLTSGQCALKYTGKSRSLTVTLRCDESLEGAVETMNVQKLFRSTAYDTVLHSYYACPKSPPAPPTLAPKPSSPSETAPSKDSSSGDSAASQSSGLSLGSKLIITFCCLFVAYVIFGTLINKYGRHMEGREAFPNYSFWLDLPNLMKEGCSFTFHRLRKLCGRGSDGSSYTTI